MILKLIVCIMTRTEQLCVYIYCYLWDDSVDCHISDGRQLPNALHDNS